MEITFLDDNTQLTAPACATIGFFDGVHRGHVALLEGLRQQACELGLQSVVVTFERHPRQVVQGGWHPQLLTTLVEKCRLLEATGLVDRLVVLRFDAAMAALSARAFMQEVLKERLCTKRLLTGYDNRFGHDRREGFSDYVAYGRELGIGVVAGRELSIEGAAVSSSRVRRLLAAGDVEAAACCLGRRYVLCGQVVHGEQIGRRLGFPTANIVPDDAEKLVPADGVYAVEVGVDGGDDRLHGVMNIGLRPTFGGSQRTIETHLLDYADTLYGHRLAVDFVARLRKEFAFDTPEALRAQLVADGEQARRIFEQIETNKKPNLAI